MSDSDESQPSTSYSRQALVKQDGQSDDSDDEGVSRSRRRPGYGGDDDDDDDEPGEDEDELEEDDGCETGDSDSSSGPPGAETCAICLARIRGEVGTPEACDHIFCLMCILEWANTSATCPQDRKPFKEVSVREELEGPVVRTVSIKKEKEQPPDIPDETPTYCEVCQECDREDRLLLCDGCDLGYHLECLEPPLDQVPVEQWFCPGCSSAQVSSVVDARQTQSARGRSRERRSGSSRPRTSGEVSSQAPRAPRLIPRTQATERVRQRIVYRRRKARAARRKSKRRAKRQRIEDGEEEDKRPAVKRMSKFSLFAGADADVDAEHAEDSYANQILSGEPPREPAYQDQASRKAAAANLLQHASFTPLPCYSGKVSNTIIDRVDAQTSEKEDDVLSSILLGQSIALSSSKKLSLSTDRKLTKDSGEGGGAEGDLLESFGKENRVMAEPLPSQRSGTSGESEQDEDASRKEDKEGSRSDEKDRDLDRRRDRNWDNTSREREENFRRQWNSGDDNRRRDWSRDNGRRGNDYNQRRYDQREQHNRYGFNPPHHRGGPPHSYRNWGSSNAQSSTQSPLEDKRRSPPRLSYQRPQAPYSYRKDRDMDRERNRHQRSPPPSPHKSSSSSSSSSGTHRDRRMDDHGPPKQRDSDTGHRGFNRQRSPTGSKDNNTRKSDTDSDTGHRGFNRQRSPMGSKDDNTRRSDTDARKSHVDHKRSRFDDNRQDSEPRKTEDSSHGRRQSSPVRDQQTESSQHGRSRNRDQHNRRSRSPGSNSQPRSSSKSHGSHYKSSEKRKGDEVDMQPDTKNKTPDNCAKLEFEGDNPAKDGEVAIASKEKTYYEYKMKLSCEKYNSESDENTQKISEGRNKLKEDVSSKSSDAKRRIQEDANEKEISKEKKSGSKKRMASLFGDDADNDAAKKFPRMDLHSMSDDDDEPSVKEKGSMSTNRGGYSTVDKQVSDGTNSSTTDNACTPSTKEKHKYIKETKGGHCSKFEKASEDMRSPQKLLVNHNGIPDHNQREAHRNYKSHGINEKSEVRTSKGYSTGRKCSESAEGKIKEKDFPEREMQDDSNFCYDKDRVSSPEYESQPAANNSSYDSPKNDWYQHTLDIIKNYKMAMEKKKLASEQTQEESGSKSVDEASSNIKTQTVDKHASHSKSSDKHSKSSRELGKSSEKHSSKSSKEVKSSEKHGSKSSRELAKSSERDRSSKDSSKSREERDSKSSKDTSKSSRKHSSKPSKEFKRSEEHESKSSKGNKSEKRKNLSDDLFGDIDNGMDTSSDVDQFTKINYNKSKRIAHSSKKDNEEESYSINKPKRIAHSSKKDSDDESHDFDEPKRIAHNSNKDSEEESYSINKPKIITHNSKKDNKEESHSFKIPKRIAHGSKKDSEETLENNSKSSSVLDSDGKVNSDPKKNARSSKEDDEEESYDLIKPKRNARGSKKDSEETLETDSESSSVLDSDGNSHPKESAHISKEDDESYDYNRPTKRIAHGSKNVSEDKSDPISKSSSGLDSEDNKPTKRISHGSKKVSEDKSDAISKSSSGLDSEGNSDAKRVTQTIKKECEETADDIPKSSSINAKRVTQTIKKECEETSDDIPKSSSILDSEGKINSNDWMKIKGENFINDVSFGSEVTTEKIRDEGSSDTSDQDTVYQSSSTGTSKAKTKSTDMTREGSNSEGKDNSKDVKQQQQVKAALEAKVVVEIKRWLDPHYRDKTIDRQEYKEIVKKCVKKVVSAECGEIIESGKMRSLVEGYVKLYKHRHTKHKQRLLSPPRQSS